MITSHSVSAGYIQSWEDDNETSQLYSHEVRVSGEVGCSVDAEVAIESALIDEESDFEEDYTGGWLYVGR